MRIVTILKGVAVCLPAALSFACGAVAAPAFLDGFAYGMSRGELEARSDVLKGEEAFKDALFFKGLRWADASWSAQCSFREDRLVGLTLYASYSADLLKAVSAHLKAQKFQLLGMVVDDKAIDMLTLARLGGPEAFRKRYRELVREKTPTSIRYEWFDATKITPEQLDTAASLGQLLTLVDSETMQVEVAQEAEGEKLERRGLAVHFSYPVLDASGRN